VSDGPSTGPGDERRLSLEAWAALPEDEPGELVDGRLVEEEEAGYAHDVAVAWLIHRLHGWVIERGGFVGASRARFAVAPARGRKPDATVYLPGSRKPPAHGLIRVPPDIAIEVVSPAPWDGRRDRIEKVKEYAGFRVRWYWIVDPQVRALQIFELGADGRYTYALGATEGRIESVPGCEGLALDVDALWAELDRLGGEGGPEGP
jgi:Uma2 family endonuclease